MEKSEKNLVVNNIRKWHASAVLELQVNEIITWGGELKYRLRHLALKIYENGLQERR